MAYGEKRVVDDLSLDVRDGELFAIVGPSGCGKTTVLRMVAGLLAPDQGKIYFGDRDVTALPPERRDAAMVFQSYALFPHLNVAENVGFGLRRLRLGRAGIAERVDRYLALVNLRGYGDREVGSLSGGEQQRVAIARAIAMEPQLLLLDEPMSNLDQRLREGTRADLRALQRRLGITTLYVTHDQHEALEMADRVAVFDHGRMVQSGPPREVYDRPISEFVATFLGHANLLDAVITDSTTAGSGLQIGATSVSITRRVAATGTSVRVVIRPECIHLMKADGDERLGNATVTAVEFHGSTETAALDLDGTRLWMTSVRASASCEARVGDRLELFVARDRIVVLTTPLTG